MLWPKDSIAISGWAADIHREGLGSTQHAYHTVSLSYPARSTSRAVLNGSSTECRSKRTVNRIDRTAYQDLSLIHISEPTRLALI
eukprot:8931288-Alexandrium_andersonii.AAC.1